jgi:sarcosine oxidase subunit gamma
MSEDVIHNPFNPLDGTSFSTGAGSGLLMGPASDCARFSLRIAGAHLEMVVEAFGQDIPADICGMSSGGQGTALCLGPDEWLLMAPEIEREGIIARFASLGDHVPHSLVDVGHRTVGIDVSGPAAALVLNTGCPLDLDKFPIGGGTRTILDKAEIILMRFERERYRLEIVRSFAGFVWNFLSVAGREFDVETGPLDQADASR